MPQFPLPAASQAPMVGPKGELLHPKTQQFPQPPCCWGGWESTPLPGPGTVHPGHVDGGSGVLATRQKLRGHQPLPAPRLGAEQIDALLGLHPAESDRQGRTLTPRHPWNPPSTLPWVQGDFLPSVPPGCQKHHPGWQQQPWG